jgi:hypothetical protein
MEVMGNMIDEPKVLIPYDRREAISVRIAARLAGVSERTVQNWCSQHNIGRRIAGGPWQISRPALTMFLDGDEEALRQYQAGERAGRVAAYFRRAGL